MKHLDLNGPGDNNKNMDLSDQEKNMFVNNEPLSESEKTNQNPSNNMDTESSYELKDVPGKVYKRPREVREKISASLKGKPKTYTSWLKGRTGSNHPAYIHGQGKNREYDSEKHAA